MRHVVAMRWGGIELTGLRGDNFLKIMRTAVALAPHADDTPERIAFQHRLDGFQKLRLPHHHLRPAVPDVKFIFGRMRERVQSEGNGSDLHGAEVAGDEFRRIAQQQQDTVFAVHSERSQRIASLVRKTDQLRIGERPSSSQQRDAGASSLGQMPVQKRGGKIKHLRQIFRSSHLAQVFIAPGKGALRGHAFLRLNKSG